ncbi:MAG: GAF domain-containing sensor histidine kinase [Ktedonobacteraceae bacterium]|nr:GAF domain-containing sensor histidine kinase [Ktedonobacteraceae bacterium]
MTLSQSQHAPTKTHESVLSSSQPLRGHLLLAARIAFLIEFVLCAVMTIAGIPLIPSFLRTVCQTNSCDIQLSPKQLQGLHAVGLSLPMYIDAVLIMSILAIAVTYSLALLLMWKKSDDRVAFLMACALIAVGTTGFSAGSTAFAATVPLWMLPHNILLFFQAFIYLPLYCFFPDGHFVPRWSRWVVLPIIVFFFVGIFFPYLIPHNPLTLIMSIVLGTPGGFVFVACSLIYRYRRTSAYEQRQQIRAVLFCIVIIALSQVVFALPVVFNNSLIYSAYYSIGGILVTYAIIIAHIFIVIAIMRYHLWNIDLLIRRTLVYGGLSVGVIGLYVLTVSSLGIVFQAQGNVLISLVATGFIAVVFQPLRLFLQRSASRLLFGERDDPYRVLAQLGQHLEGTITPEVMVPTLVETVARALKFPFVAISRHAEAQGATTDLEAAYGEVPDDVSLIQIPLVYQQEAIGSLVLAPRQRGEALTPPDRRLLTALAPQIGAAVHAMRLTADLKQANLALQSSREHLVTTREEERRRLRRDLHDGLGPQLSSQVLTLTAASRLLSQDVGKAESLLSDAIIHAQDAIVDIRRLVYALRPPALDDLGLVAALQEQINHYRTGGVQITLHAPESLPPLSAAVEMACYRIVQEALTNVIRHAHAQTCRVQFMVDTQVVLEVQDDGQGISPMMRQGVGFTSMRERAEELGGSFAWFAGEQGGVLVRACLPFAEERVADDTR